MMDPLKLKDGILNLAFSGKLIKNHIFDDSLLKKYTNLLNDKIKNGSKSEKNNLKMDVELPYELPDNWFWGKLKVISKITYGFPFNSQLFNENQKGMPLIRIRNILSSETTTYTTENASDEYFIKKGDMLVGMDGNFNVNLWNGPVAYLNQRTCKIDANEEIILQKYLYYFLPIALDEIFKNVSYVTVKHLSDKHLSSMIIPIPPLEEQKNIVDKIEEIFPLIEKYKINWEKIETNNKKLPIQLRKSILDMAIKGKLIKSNDTDAAEKLYSQIQKDKKKHILNKNIKNKSQSLEITNEEILFDIPEHWKWVRIDDLFYHNTGKALNSRNTEGTLKKYLTTSNVYWNHFKMDSLKEMYYTEKELEKCSVIKGDLLVCEGGDVGRAAIWPYDYSLCLQNHIHKLRAYSKIEVKFYYYVFNYYKQIGLINGKGIGIKGLSTNTLGSLVVPLPPLEEQYKIVSKIEELFSICDKLEKTLN